MTDERADEDLRRVDWYAAQLRGQRFERCDLTAADLTEATTQGCTVLRPASCGR